MFSSQKTNSSLIHPVRSASIVRQDLHSVGLSQDAGLHVSALPKFWQIEFRLKKHHQYQRTTSGKSPLAAVFYETFQTTPGNATGVGKQNINIYAA
jgi:predicted amino acid dehydrogenase